ALLAVLELGAGSAAAIKRRLVSVGATNIIVQAGPASRNGVSLGSGTTRTLMPEDADAVRRECPSVSAVAPLVVTRGQVVHGNRNWNTLYVYGTTPDFLRVRDWEGLAEGEPFTADDVRDGGMVCVLGQTIADELFEGQSPVGREVCVGDVRFRVLGVLRRKGTNMIGIDQDDIFLAPWTTIKARVTGTSGAAPPQDVASSRYPGTPGALFPERSPAQRLNEPQLVRFANVDYLLVQAPSPEEIPAACGQITRLLRERHHIAPGEKDDFGVREFTEVIAVVNGTVRLLAAVLLVVALVSLLVGGIGIMNIMLVSVTERTREVGLRMAVGATAGAVLRQFLAEAVVLCLFGGALGIALGRVITFLAWRLAHCPSASSPLPLLGAAGASLAVGVLFGYYPAWRASRLDPIGALRYE
ncbi:MAG TPA: ABC transporter permease, partial [Gemmataceae bacterium]|nr:ABC transporter permease [Gemmataceae bacterium]